VNRRPARARELGVSLVELLVATVVAGVVLAGSWAWLWSVAAPAHSLDASAQATSAAAFAMRAVTRDLEESTALLTPTACAADRGLLLEHRHPASAPEQVAIVWDASRRVLWRKTSSTYLADHVTRFAVTYLSPDGDGVRAGSAGSELAGVARVRVDLTVETAGRAWTRRADVVLRLR
jgi:type II secretory pathway component PulJ